MRIIIESQDEANEENQNLISEFVEKFERVNGEDSIELSIPGGIKNPKP